jgi:hypothetical protein
MEIEHLYRLFSEHQTVTTDSRDCPEGSIFFALKGESFDGNRFAETALQKGCSYAVIDEPEYARDERYIVTDNALDTLKLLARHHRRQFDIPVIGITGTNGKTTTKELVAAVLSKKYKVLYTEGNFNNDIGVPKTLLRLRKEHEIAVIEMGASHPGDIKTLVETVEPDYGLITNVGKAHLQGFGSFEEYCEKKVGIGKRHGYNFIQVYEKFGEEKLQQLQGLGITKLLEIAKLDDEDAEDLMRNNDVSGLSTRELSAEVEKYKNKYEQLTMLLEEEKSKNAESASLESQVEELKRFAAILNNKALKEKAEAIKEHQSEMKKLTADRDKQINELKKKQTDYEELEQRYKEIASRPAEISEEERNVLIQQGRDEMCKEKDEDWSNVVELARKTATRNTEKKFTEEISSLKILNDELRKVADGAKESAKKYKDELEKQKAENAALQSNAQVVEAPAPSPTSGARDKVKFYFKQIETAFTAATEAVSEADTEERAELTSALKKVLERMGAILEQT